MSRAWFAAAHSGDVCTLRSLMDTYIRSKDENGETALLIAIREGHLNAIQLLAVHELTIRSLTGVSPLVASVHQRRMDIVHILIRNPQLLTVQDMDEAIAAAHHEGAFEDILVHTRRIVAILNDASSLLSTRSPTATSLNGSKAGFETQGLGGTMHTNMNTLFGIGLNTPQFDFGKSNNLKQSDVNRLSSSLRTTENINIAGKGISDSSDLALGVPLDSQDIELPDMLNTSLTRENQDQEAASASEQRIDFADSLQNSSNTVLNSQQSPRQDTPTNLSNIELAERPEDLDFSDGKDQAPATIDVIDSFQDSVQSSSVCKQTPLPENNRFLTITPCTRTAHGSEIQSTEVPAMSIRDFSPRFRRNPDAFQLPSGKSSTKLKKMLHTPTPTYTMLTYDSGDSSHCPCCTQYIEQISTMQTLITNLESRISGLYGKVKEITADRDKWKEHAENETEKIKAKQQYIHTLEERIAKMVTELSRDAQKQCSDMDPDKNTALINNAIIGNLQGIYAYISQAGHVNAYGQTALMLAAKNNQSEVVAILAPLEAKRFCCYGKTALMYASETNSVECIEILLDFEKCMASPSINLLESAHDYGEVSSVSGRTALMIAAKVDAIQAAKLLVEDEAGMQMSNGVTALMVAISKGHEQIAHMLLLKESGMETKEGDFALRRAVHKRMRGVISTLMYAEERLMNSVGWTPMMIYTMLSDLDSVKQYAASDHGKRDINGCTALMISVRLRLTPITKFLASKESGIMDLQGRTALIIAIQLENISAIKVLAPFERNINSLSGLTPLDYIPQKSQSKKRIKEILTKAY
ncbi:Protein 21.1 [Giardia lamblia P15]|uniref:Protein 21.1 n=1 Tax=Giardia intestinalis (strain P15) TaxID=658858 RepID=E1F3A4_GIAIA|nr:Protein 21.1 [Giardia lamblia P15]